MKFLISVVILAAFCGVQARNLIENPQNGIEIIKGSQALIRAGDANGFWGYCAGVIVHPRLVFVAYQCSSWTTKMELKAGYEHLDNDDENTPWLHQDCYSLNLDLNSNYAFGMLIFINPITGGKIAVAKLQTTGHNVIEEQTVYVPSYNTYGANKEIESLDLSVKTYQTFDHDKCHHIYQAVVNEYNFCYGDADNSATCEVDIGGVLYSEDGTFLGLTQFRDSVQCNAERPAISINFGHELVIEFLKFIMRKDNSYTINCTMGNNNQLNRTPYGIQLQF